MTWGKLDDQLGVHPKLIRIPRRQRLACVGLWTLALNYATRALTDGIVEDYMLDELGASDELVARLVEVGLWHAQGHECPRCQQPPAGGIMIHDFLDPRYNKPKALILEEREAERVRKANQRDKRRTPSGSPAGVPAGHPQGLHPDSNGRPNTPSSSRPVPSLEEDPNHLPQEPHQSNAGARDELQEDLSTLGATSIGSLRHDLAEFFDGDPSDGEVIDLTREILQLAQAPVIHPEAYIRKAAADSAPRVKAMAIDVQRRSPRKVLAQ